jgi:AraC-like DNA-binding protein
MRQIGSSLEQETQRRAIGGSFCTADPTTNNSKKSIPRGDVVMPVCNSLPPATDKCLLSVWDAQYVPSSKAFGLYRETICKIYMPWSPEFGADDFQARLETAQVEDGTICRHQCSPHLSIRTAQDIANSERECSYLVQVQGGGLKCQQDDSMAFAQAGDILLLDSSRPTKAWLEGCFDALVVTIPKSELRGSAGVKHQPRNVLLARGHTPLSKCLHLMAALMTRASPEEMAAIYRAVCSLLPIEAGYFECAPSVDEEKTHINYLLKSILGHIDQNIANTDLTPNQVADQFGISVRYVHKLFVGCGMTFRSYATTRRLEYVCKDLTSSASRREQISQVAFRWGFNDLSSFNRAFKVRYGCTPSQYRHRAGP